MPRKYSHTRCQRVIPQFRGEFTVENAEKAENRQDCSGVPLRSRRPLRFLFRVREPVPHELSRRQVSRDISPIH